MRVLDKIRSFAEETEVYELMLKDDAPVDSYTMIAGCLTKGYEEFGHASGTTSGRSG